MVRDRDAGARGRALYEIVERFAAFGDHRTGSVTEAMTAQWIAGLLTDVGLEVTVDEVPYAGWTGAAELDVDGVALECLAVPYEWCGSLETGRAAVVAFDPMMGGFPEVLTAPIATARRAGADAAVLVTRHTDGSLVGVNRILGAPVSDFPTALAAGRDEQRLLAGPVHVSLTSGPTPSVMRNVVARTPAPGDPIVFTTPLTGWFSCAGERGTGLAVLLDLVERFVHLPLLVVATGGHELGYVGAHRWVDANAVRPRCIVHVGASIAVDAPDDAGGRSLVPTRVAMTSLGEPDAHAIGAALSPVGLPVTAAATQFLGEGEAWARVGAPLLSTTGAGVDFHTPQDTPSRVTSPASLEAVADAMAEAATELLRIVEDPR